MAVNRIKEITGRSMPAEDVKLSPREKRPETPPRRASDAILMSSSNRRCGPRLNLSFTMLRHRRPGNASWDERQWLF
jgi:hypothetical protein